MEELQVVPRPVQMEFLFVFFFNHYGCIIFLIHLRVCFLISSPAPITCCPSPSIEIAKIDF